MKSSDFDFNRKNLVSRTQFVVQFVVIHTPCPYAIFVNKFPGLKLKIDMGFSAVSYCLAGIERINISNKADSYLEHLFPELLSIYLSRDTNNKSVSKLMDKGCIFLKIFLSKVIRIDVIVPVTVKILQACNIIAVMAVWLLFLFSYLQVYVYLLFVILIKA